MTLAPLRIGLAGAVVLSLGAVVFAMLGLSPSLRWIPELPLLAGAALFPVAVCGVTGYRAGGTGPGAIAGGIAGGVGGSVAGFAYVVFGKSPINVVGGLVVGVVGGAIIGLAAAALRSLKTRPVTERSPEPRSRS